MEIPFLSFTETNKQIKSEIMQSFEAFFDKGWYILGDCVKKFEHSYSTFNKVKHTVGLSNGLDALHVSLKALGIGPGDEVIIPSNTYIATALAVSYVGATPKFVEPNINTYNIDPMLIEASISEKTKAIIPVHLYGQACEMSTIMEIAKKYNLFVIEDNAQAQGASYKGKLTGTWGNINATSFYPGKNLGALGDAGAITTNDDNLAKQANMLRNYGSERKYLNEIIGHNMRLDECQAAFLSVKLAHLNDWTAERQQIASWYQAALTGVSDLVVPATADFATHVYHVYLVRTKKRNELQAHLQSNQIGTLIHYPIPPHLQPAYKKLDYCNGSFPIAEEIANTCLSLPIYPGLRMEQIDYITSHIREFFN